MTDARYSSVVSRIDYDEFGLFHENLHEHGLALDRLPVVRRASVEVGTGRHLSALVWGEAEPELVLLHGGGQNAHTWDTVSLALGRPLVAIDLPGHGHSDAPAANVGGPLSVDANARDVAVAMRALAPHARALVGMSLGGMTAIGICAIAPELVRSLALVDITPGVTAEKAKAITAFINGPVSFPSFDELLARTVQHNPTRSESSLRRGILHNALQRDDGTWVWRYRRFDQPVPADDGAGEPRSIDHETLWDALARVTAPVMLVRGMTSQSVVDDADEQHLLRLLPNARVEHVEDAGHSIQGDQPLALATLLESFLAAAG